MCRNAATAVTVDNDANGDTDKGRVRLDVTDPPIICL